MTSPITTFAAFCRRRRQCHRQIVRHYLFSEAGTAGRSLAKSDEHILMETFVSRMCVCVGTAVIETKFLYLFAVTCNAAKKKVEHP